MRVSETVSPVKSVGTAQRPLYYPCSELSLYLGILTRVVWATFHILGSEGVAKQPSPPLFFFFFLYASLGGLGGEIMHGMSCLT